MQTDLTPVYEALAAVADFATLAKEDINITRLGGMTNLVFKAEAKQAPFAVIVRLAGAGTDDYINRAVELHNAQAAARAGVSPEILWADSKTGIMITRCLDPIVTMTPEEFKQRSGAPARAGAALQILHNSGERFDFHFELFTMIDDYLKLLSGKDITLPDGYHEIVESALPIKQLLSEHPAQLAPCHCDPLCENFLDTGEKMWIVDWEYSGMNDPMWDLGDLSVEAGFDHDQDMEMMHAYFAKAPTAAQFGRMIVYKAMCDLLWTLWGLIQHADNNPAEDFWAYAITRFERCKKLMQSEDFPNHLDAIRKE